MPLPFSPIGTPIGFFAVLVSIATLAVHLVFAVGVYRAGQQIYHDRKFTTFAEPFTWALATALGGVPMAAIFWVIHYSTLRPPDRRP